MSSHKHLKSVSHNFGHSFISLMNYIGNDYFMGELLKQARKTGLDRLSVDILNNTAEPSDLLTKPMTKSIDYWNKWFPQLVEDSGSSMNFVSKATMVIQYDLKLARPYSSDSKYLENPFNCTITITDNRGKEYSHRHEGWWFPEN
ncbi:MAG: hypothetical protein ABJQ37_06605 [Reichenbachiella sp.]|uniref:hypothetical protein n=2 Tax=Reichenbachiella sp. TaxID=2184521 RepID=UPI003296A742